MLRHKAKGRRELMRAELGEGLDHLRQAATHAAGEVGATVGPQLNAVGPALMSARQRVAPGAERVRDAASHGWDSTVSTLSPLVAAARSGASEAGRQTSRATARVTGKKKKKSMMSGKRTGLLVGLLAAGAAVGVVGAMVARRRGQSKWEEYESGVGMADNQAPPLTDSSLSAMDMGAGSPGGGPGPVNGAEQAPIWGASASDAPGPVIAGPNGATAADHSTSATKNSPN